MPQDTADSRTGSSMAHIMILREVLGSQPTQCTTHITPPPLLLLLLLLLLGLLRDQKSWVSCPRCCCQGRNAGQHAASD